MLKLILQISTVQFFILVGVANANSQWDKLKGKWIDSSQRYIQIFDTIGQRNSISNQQQYDREYFLKVANDTIRFYSQYTTSRDKFSKEHFDNYYFRIISVTDSFLTIIPISELSRKIVGTSSELKFKRKEYSVDNTIQLEKIIFHSDGCAWGCPVIAIQIDNSGQIMYRREKGVWEKAGDSLWGNYKGRLPRKTYDHLLSLIKTSNIRHLKYAESYCCDGSVKTIIVYIKNRRIYIKSMFFPYVIQDLVNFFYDEKKFENLEKTNEEFDIEM